MNGYAFLSDGRLQRIFNEFKHNTTESNFDILVISKFQRLSFHDRIPYSSQQFFLFLASFLIRSSNFEGRWRIPSRFPIKAFWCEVSSSLRGIWVMEHPCCYFLGTSFSKIFNFNREFKTKSFRKRISIICRSSVAAIYQNKPLSPVSFFNCRNGLFRKIFLVTWNDRNGGIETKLCLSNA